MIKSLKLLALLLGMTVTADGYRRYCYCETISTYSDIYDPLYPYNYWVYNGTYYNYYDQFGLPIAETTDWSGNTTVFDVRSKKPNTDNKSQPPSAPTKTKIPKPKTNSTRIQFD